MQIINTCHQNTHQVDAVPHVEAAPAAKDAAIVPTHHLHKKTRLL